MSMTSSSVKSGLINRSIVSLCPNSLGMTKQLILLMLMSAVSSLADDGLKVTDLSSVKYDKEALRQLVV